MKARKMEITLEQALRWYNSDNNELKGIALKIFPEVTTIKPRKWENLQKIDGYFVSSLGLVKQKKGDAHITNRNVFYTEQQAQAAIALAMLTQLANYWCDDYGDYIFEMNSIGELNVVFRTDINHTMFAFDKQSDAEDFLELYEGLIRKAAILTVHQ
jgi:hypothetical protein